MVDFLNKLDGWLWGAPVLILLACVGLLYGIRTKFFQFRKLGEWGQLARNGRDKEVMVGWRVEAMEPKAEWGRRQTRRRGPEFLILSCPVKKGGIPPF